MKINKIYYRLLGILFLILISCNEDRVDENTFGSITGKVVSVGDNTPIPNVRVSTQPLTSTVFTDEEGQFVIEDVTIGEYSVEARVEGFLTDFEPANVIANVVANVIFELEISTINNRPPLTPELINPLENVVLQTTEVVFEWSSSDPEEDPLTYTLELRNNQDDEILLFEDLTETTYTYSELMLGVSYYWQVSVKDEYNDPVLSPFGEFSVIPAPVENRFLFTRNMDGNNVIFSTDEEGNEYRLTSLNLNSYRPRRNVAANRIAYLQTDGAQVDIYTMKRDGTDKVRVTSNIKPNGFNLNEINFSWPPTSDKIYFPQLDKLYRINSNGQGIEMVYQTTDGSLISEVDVSETANIIALKTNNLSGYEISIFTIDFNGNVLDTVLSGVEGAASGLNLSVTNQKVLYSYDVSGFQSTSYRRLDSRLFIYEWTTNSTTDISVNKPVGTNDLEPIFSPNEAFAIFTNTSNDGISQKNVFKIEVVPDGNTDSRQELYLNAFMPDWE